jgi:hypothetical protein
VGAILTDALGIAAILASFVVLAACILWVRDRIFYPPLTAAEQEARRLDHERRLLNPDWAVVRSRFGGEVPEAVAALYNDQDLLQSGFLEVNEYTDITQFAPADATAFDPAQCFHAADDAFVFARTTMGDPLYVRTSELAAGLPVYLHYHDGGDTERLASTLREFLSLVRTANKA